MSFWLGFIIGFIAAIIIGFLICIIAKAASEMTYTAVVRNARTER